MVIQLKASLDIEGEVVNGNQELWSYAHSTWPYDPDGCNLLAAWKLQKTLPAGPSRNIPQPSGGSNRNALPLYAFPQQKVSNHSLLDMPVRTSALRTLGAYANVFALESFMDELAAAAGADPLAFRLKHLTDARGRDVLERTTSMAQWQPAAAAIASGGMLKRGGLDFAKYKNLAVYYAVIVDVAVDTLSGAVRVERVWLAVDAGLLINPDGLRNQIEGGIIQSTSWTLHEAMTNNSTHQLTRN